MRKLLASIMVLVFVIAFAPAHAAVTFVNGYAFGYYGGFGDPDDYLIVGFGTGGPVYVPGAVDAGAGGGGILNIEVQSQTTYQTKIDVDVALVHTSVTTDGDFRVVDARGIGTDGNCWGISLAVNGSQSEIYVGVAANAASTVSDPNGACVAKSRQFLAYGEFIFTDV